MVGHYDRQDQRGEIQSQLEEEVWNVLKEYAMYIRTDRERGKIRG